MKRTHPERLKQNGKHEKRVKMPSYARLKNKLDSVFSLFIRYRDTDKDGLIKCVTCETRKPLKEMQCGHFCPRQHLSTRWEEKNCSSQDYICNVCRHGEQYKHGLALDRRWGQGTADRMVALSRIPTKFNRHEIIAMIEKYQNLTALMMVDKIKKDLDK